MTAISTVDALAPEGETGLFPALLRGLQAFRAKVEDEDDPDVQKLLLLQPMAADALAKKIVVATLQTLADLLAWIHGAVTDIARYLTPLDALLAVVGMVGKAIEALGEVFSEQWPAAYGTAPTAVGEGFSDVGSAIAAIDQQPLPTLIPDPSTLTAIAKVVVDLLGTRVDPQVGAAGSLVDLTASITGAPAGP
ncbi:MAG: hypothetical protein KC431_04920 [Myxococcales bacterium]|nr:hypothetical protein [Myxococcales bacterium]MCA9696848.1 hypothetical protein [Myxococcales bacterium]